MRGYNTDGSWRWTRSLTLDPVNYRPMKPTLSVYNGTIVGPTLSFRGDAHRPALTARVYRSESERTNAVAIPLAAQGVFSFSGLSIPYGETHISVWASNGFGAGPKASLRVYNLGTDLPTVKRYVLISKRILWMFDVRYGRVIHRWPVAIGTPQTPTPTGTFFIGKAQTTSGAWGPLRRPLYRRHDGVYRGSGYYIHGTNEPWSIGMMASHGCVRMYNHDIREFERVVPDYTRVRIR